VSSLGFVNIDLGGKVVLKVLGVDIFNGSDTFQFAYLPLVGDGKITTEIKSLDNTDPSAKGRV